MVAAGSGIAGAVALLPSAEANAPEDAVAAAATGPTAMLAGGTCDCEASADYTRGSVYPWVGGG